MDESAIPQSLMQAVRYFADLDVCVDFVAAMRWENGVTCPHCEGKEGLVPHQPPHLEVHEQGMPQAIQRQDRDCL